MKNKSSCACFTVWNLFVVVFCAACGGGLVSSTGAGQLTAGSSRELSATHSKRTDALDGNIQQNEPREVLFSRDPLPPRELINYLAVLYGQMLNSDEKKEMAKIVKDNFEFPFQYKV